MRGPSERALREEVLPRNVSVPESEGVGEHVRTRSHSGLWAR